jgi:hypothetical protein
MLESVVGQWAGSTLLKKAKRTIVVYSLGESISSQLPESLSVGWVGYDTTTGAASVLGALRQQSCFVAVTIRSHPPTFMAPTVRLCTS